MDPFGIVEDSIIHKLLMKQLLVLDDVHLKKEVMPFDDIADGRLRNCL
jgi:hypothetical protein